MQIGPTGASNGASGDALVDAPRHGAIGSCATDGAAPVAATQRGSPQDAIRSARTMPEADGGIDGMRSGRRLGAEQDHAVTHQRIPPPQARALIAQVQVVIPELKGPALPELGSAPAVAVR